MSFVMLWKVCVVSIFIIIKRLQCMLASNISLICSPECMKEMHEHTMSNVNKAKEAINQSNRVEAERYAKLADAGNNCPLCRAKLPYTPEQSFAYSLKNAQKGHVYAQHAVATKYESGKGTAKDYKEAAKWFEAATKGGHPWSPSSYGFILQNGGYGVRRDIEKAKEMYELSMKYQHPIGYYYMGNLYENGIGLPKKDEKEAARLYRIGAEMGFDNAQCSLGNCYDFGMGVTPNPEEALKWYLLSAEQGVNTTAMMNAGATMMKIAQMRYGDTSIVGHSPVPRAFCWLKRAAKLGESDATMIMQQIEGNCKSSCAQCNKSASMAKLTRCAKCKLFHYCGKQCQIAHWKAGHKLDCVKTDIA